MIFQGRELQEGRDILYSRRFGRISVLMAPDPYGCIFGEDRDGIGQRWDRDGYLSGHVLREVGGSADLFWGPEAA